MTYFLISFEDGSMIFPEEELPDVAAAARAVVQEAKNTGVWVFGGGVNYEEGESVVATDGTTTHGSKPVGKERVGGMSILDLPSRTEALEWAAKFAVACRCAQDVREFMYDPESV